jgi:hypothetical protein
LPSVAAVPIDVDGNRPCSAQAFASVHSGSANLVLVCDRHHTLIHQQGFQLHVIGVLVQQAA